ncbi:uncharacterized protein LOC135948797 [Calliphora vicina]|uniref:uncharacterized protein LOC135948797 n=1 Tax=Calliphora vicina TaxID=7373 RepID=UPI00325BE541
MLHREISTSESSVNDASAQASNTASVTPSTTALNSTQLPSSSSNNSGTAMVNVILQGVTYPARALIDPASESSFVSEHFQCRLKLSTHSTNVKVSEETPKKKILTPFDKICEENYRRTTRRDSNGRYVVTLPFKTEFPQSIGLGSSKRNVTAQFLRTESCLLRKPEVKALYDEVVQEYLTLNHMKPVLDEATPPFLSCYLPHHPVIKPDWKTTKLRVVFNASNRTSNDASEKAYAGVIYIRVETLGQVHTHLLSCKTKVATIKSINLPRLELCGAVLASELLKTVVGEIDIPIKKIYCWTDSTIVLCWLRKTPSNWTTFLANRVCRIQENIGKHNWYHIRSEENPEDLGSRGVSPSVLAQSDLWWHRPKWLRMHKSSWDIKELSLLETDMEVRTVRTHASFFVNYEDVLDRFLSLDRALRVIAYMFRFLNRTHPARRDSCYCSTTTISSVEIGQVKLRLAILAQKVHFPREYQALNLGRPISSKSPLLPLNPRLDKDNVMRLNGRLEKSPSLSYTEKYPIILPYLCRFTRLLIEFVHLITIHGGNQLMLRTIRIEYWVPRLKVIVCTVINRCKRCLLDRKRSCSQIMAALPSERTTLDRPFTNTGVDFTGPFDMRNFIGRSCQISKAYVSSREIEKDFLTFLKESQVRMSSVFGIRGLSWRFIPAGAPHMGGLWEAAVKIFKRHFRKEAQMVKYTFEELSTILARIEACLNSRPLCPLSDNPSEPVALTPGHFLIGSPIIALPEPSIYESPIGLVNRYRKVKAFTHEFCRRWKEEYLSNLHKRYKWKSPERDISIDDLVAIRNEQMSPPSWKLGRVVRTYPGSDSHVRVADIRTENGVIKRPITKLVVLTS